MTTANIEIAYVNPPKAGKKQGSIKTATGEYYNVWPDKLHLFKVGPCVVEYQERLFDGKTFKTAVGVVNGGLDFPPSDSVGAKKYDTSVSHAVVHAVAPPHDYAKNKHIFVCGGLNAAIKAGQVRADDTAGVTIIVENLLEVYGKTLGA